MAITLRLGDSDEARQERTLPVWLVLDNLRSAYNVGNIFRVAEATRAAGIVTCGYTATPPHIKLQKTARGCDELVPCEHFDSTAEAVASLRGRGMKVYAVETVEESKLYWEAPIELPCALVLGNEAHGVSREMLEFADKRVRIEIQNIESLNVAIAGAIAMYELTK